MNEEGREEKNQTNRLQSCFFSYTHIGANIMCSTPIKFDLTYEKKKE